MESVGWTIHSWGKWRSSPGDIRSGPRGACRSGASDWARETPSPSNAPGALGAARRRRHGSGHDDHRWKWTGSATGAAGAEVIVLSSSKASAWPRNWPTGSTKTVSAGVLGWRHHSSASASTISTPPPGDGRTEGPSSGEEKAVPIADGRRGESSNGWPPSTTGMARWTAMFA
jgi:hypothetical protein